ncbi:MAG: hypothetical protein HYY37_06715 [Candidatus Aenigmarchaeota archaeon]|nr:hypothetical protein [Candidatus Aenigmarchaeota archaeon]
MDIEKLLAGYPGRGIFLGLTGTSPCFAYFVTGRSTASMERRAVVDGSHVRIEPLQGRRSDALRHYECIRTSSRSAFITNGSHIAAIARPFMNKVLLAEALRKAGHEKDGLKTPRIAGAILPGNRMYLGIVSSHPVVRKLETKTGSMSGIVTYNGDVSRPEPFDAAALSVPIRAETPETLARFFFDMLNKDLRVCAVAGVLKEQWHLHAVNRN